MRAIDGDRLKRKAQKVATEAWKMKMKASVETILNEFMDWIDDAPTIEPERPSEIQDILNFLDTALHPLISPEHWNVYSELYDMISN